MGKKTKVVIDTNVIVSAFGWHGKPKDVVRLASSGKIVNFISAEILDELRRVISYPKFCFPETLHAEILETMFSISTLIESGEIVYVIKDDPSDNRILECAVSAGAEFIITGDSHLLNLKNFKGIEILTPDDFLDMQI